MKMETERTDSDVGCICIRCARCSQLHSAKHGMEMHHQLSLVLQIPSEKVSTDPKTHLQIPSQKVFGAVGSIQVF